MDAGPTNVRPLDNHAVSSFNDQRHRAVIDQRHLHVSTEYALLDRYARIRHGIAEHRDERLSELWPSSVHERWSPSLPHITCKRELRNDQHRATGLIQTDVHLALDITENPQSGDLPCGSDRIRLSVRRNEANQHQQTGTDRTDDRIVNLDRRLADPLNYRPHIAPHLRQQSNLHSPP